MNKSLLFIFVLLTSCSDDKTLTPGIDPETFDAGECLCLATSTDFMTGSLSVFSLASGKSELDILPEHTSSDPVIRWEGKNAYLLNRLGSDQVMVLEPRTFALVEVLDIGAGANPQDVTAWGDKLIVSTHGDPTETNPVRSEIQIWPLNKGALSPDSIIPLQEYSSGSEDGSNVEASAIALRNDVLVVALQHLANGKGELDAFTPATTGTLLVFDLSEPSPVLVTSIAMASHNPISDFYKRGQELLIGTSKDPFAMPDGEGCLESVDLVAKSSTCLANNSELGGYVSSALVLDNGESLLSISTGFGTSLLKTMDANDALSTAVDLGAHQPSDIGGCADTVAYGEITSGSFFHFDIASAAWTPSAPVETGLPGFSMACAELK